jgi:hypothetical protein
VASLLLKTGYITIYSQGRKTSNVNTKNCYFSPSLTLTLEASTGVQVSHANPASEWSNVISYGDTTIAQDSPNDYASLMEVTPAMIFAYLIREKLIAMCRMSSWQGKNLPFGWGLYPT